jgi:hypothetical protein
VSASLRAGDSGDTVGLLADSAFVTELSRLRFLLSGLPCPPPRQQRQRSPRPPQQVQRPRPHPVNPMTATEGHPHHSTCTPFNVSRTLPIICSLLVVILSSRTRRWWRFAPLYVRRFTFLATLFLLLFVSSAIILRSFILRRRFRRRIEEAILAGVIPPPQTGRVNRRRVIGEKPKLWEARVCPASGDRWDTIVVRFPFLCCYF